jgi:hypothetical protein
MSCNFFGPRAVKTFLGPSGNTFDKAKIEDDIFTLNISLLVEKYLQRAVQKTSTGRIWNAGRTLPTPALDDE